MKKLFLFLLTCCLGQTGMLRAADTDISSLDNVIYIESFSAKPGSSELDVSFKMKNAAAIRGFQFSLTLPEGVTPATYGSGAIKCTLAAARLGEGDQHTINVEAQADGSYKFLCGSLADETFIGTDGEVAVLKVNIAADMAEGAYPIVLTSMKLTETDISKFYETERVESTLTIDKSLRTVLDETSSTAPEAATGADVLVRRTIKADEWSTICLPFAMTAEQVTAAFGSGVQLADFTGWSSEKDGEGAIVGIDVKFTPVTAIEANHPYIIKVADAVSEFTADGVDIAPEAEPKVQVGKRTSERGYMYGTYTPTLVPEENVFLSGGKFWYSTGKSPVKAFRAYFEFRDVLDSYYDVASVRFTLTVGETTGISLTPDPSPMGEGSGYYTLDGRKVSGQPTKKGLYIKSGKKHMVN